MTATTQMGTVPYSRRLTQVSSWRISRHHSKSIRKEAAMNFERKNRTNSAMRTAIGVTRRRVGPNVRCDMSYRIVPVTGSEHVQGQGGGRAVVPVDSEPVPAPDHPPVHDRR